MNNSTEQRYRKKMAELGGPGRFHRVCSLFRSGREIVTMRVLERKPLLTGRELKLEVARNNVPQRSDRAKATCSRGRL